MTERSVVIRLKGEIGDFQAKMKQAQMSIGATVATMNSASKQGAAMRQNFSTVANAAGKVGLAAVAGLGMATKAAMDWESAWAGVQKTVDETDTTSYGKLEDDLRELARTLPATHTEIAAVAEAAGQLGIAADDVSSFTKVMIDLGETTNLTADEAATGIARFSNVMQLAAGDVDRVGATLVELGNNSETTEREILEIGQRMAAAGQIAGLSAAEVLGFGATLTSVGVEAEAGGTAMSKVFTSVRDAAIDGGDKLELFAQTAGVSAEEFRAAFQDDAAGAVDMFIGGLGRMSDAGESTSGVFKDLKLTDERLKRALLSTASAQDHLTDRLEMGRDAWEENTALAIEAAKRYETSAAQMQIAWNNVKDAAIEFGEFALPVLAAGAEKAAAFAQAMGSLPGPVKAAGTSLLGITAVLGGGLWFTSKVLNGVHEMNDALKGLGAKGDIASKAMKGVGAAAAIVAGLAAMDALQRQAGDSLGMEAMTKEIIELAEAEATALEELQEARKSLALDPLSGITGAAGVQQLATEFDTLGESVQRLTDKNWAQKLQDSIYSKASFLGSDSVFDEAVGDIEALDEALASMANAGAGDVAAQFLDNLVDSGKLTSEELEILTPLLENYEAALLGIENEAALAADGSDDFAGALGELEDAAGEATAELYTLENVLALLFGGLDADAAFVEWRGALKGLVDDLKGGEGAFSAFTEKGRENRDEFRGGLEDLRAWAEAQYELDGSSTALTRRLLEGREAAIAQAKAAGIGKDQTRAYLKELGLTPKDIRTTVSLLGTAKAEDALDGVKDKADALDESDPVVRIVADATQALSAIRETQLALAGLREGKVVVTGSNTVNRANRALAQADGGYIRGPGTATSDSIPAYLSNGEYVIKTAAVNKYGTAMFDELNSMRFASGGFVAATRPAPAPAFANGGPVSGGSGGREVPLIHIGELRHNDMRETARWVREKSVLESGGGVNF